MPGSRILESGIYHILLEPSSAEASSTRSTEATSAISAATESASASTTLTASEGSSASKEVQTVDDVQHGIARNGIIFCLTA